MKFLTDQDVYDTTVRAIRDAGHDVVMASQLGLAQAADDELLRVAQGEGRIFVTRDRDFGGLIFIRGGKGGVVYLRISPSTQNAVHEELKRVLMLYTEQELLGSFVVIEPGRHRIRKRPAAPTV